MDRIIKCIWVGLALTLFSCSVFKKVNKTSTEVDTKTKSEVTETLQSKTETESKDKTVTTIEADTVISVPVITETGEIITKKIPVKFKKTIVKDEQKKVTTTTKSDSTATVKESKKVAVQDKDKDVKRTGFPWWVWLIAAIIAILFVLWQVKKRT